MEKDTSDKIIDTALPLFAKKGFAAVSIREIANAAQVNSSAISYYFKGKEGLYQATLERNFSAVDNLLQKVSAMTHLTATECLTFYAKGVAIAHQERPFLIRLMNTEFANPTPCGQEVAKKYISRIYQFLYSSLQKGVQDGEFSPDLNLSYAAISLAGIMNFYFIAKPMVNELATLSEHPDEDYNAQALKIYLEGIRLR